MELQEAICNRRTVRDFSDNEVDFEIIRKSLEAGLKAPSYNHLKQWDFVFIKDINVRLALTQTEEMVDNLTDELVQLFEGHDLIAKEMYFDAIPKQKKMILTAPEVMVVVYQPKTQIDVSTRVYDLNCLASVWCCIENFLLSLAEDNVFAVTFIPKNTTAIKRILNIPEELEVAAIIPFGYKDSNTRDVPQKQLQLETKIHINKW